MLPFPVTKLGKGKKREGFLACCVHSEIELLHSLRSGHRAGSFPKQHDWWWCRTCRDISANTVGQAHTNTQTPARLRSHERKAHQSFGCGDVSFLNTQKAFFALAYELYTILSNALWIWAPWKGTFLSVKNPPSPTPQFCTSVRNSLSAPNIQSGSDTLLPLPKKCLINLNAGLSFHKKLIEKSEIYFLFSSSFHQEGENPPWKEQ